MGRLVHHLGHALGALQLSAGLGMVSRPEGALVPTRRTRCSAWDLVSAAPLDPADLSSPFPSRFLIPAWSGTALARRGASAVKTNRARRLCEPTDAIHDASLHEPFTTGSAGRGSLLLVFDARGDL
jgi:hypothetical protein